MLHAADYTEHHTVNVVRVYRVYILHFMTFGYYISARGGTIVLGKEVTDTLFKKGCYSSTPQI